MVDVKIVLLILINSSLSLSLHGWGGLILVVLFMMVGGGWVDFELGLRWLVKVG